MIETILRQELFFVPQALLDYYENAVEGLVRAEQPMHLKVGTMA